MLDPRGRPVEEEAALVRQPARKQRGARPSRRRGPTAIAGTAGSSSMSTRGPRGAHREHRGPQYEDEVRSPPVLCGAQVAIRFEGDPAPGARVDELVPIGLEGSIDEDLLEDSTLRITTHLRELGYRDARVTHSRLEEPGQLVRRVHGRVGAAIPSSTSSRSPAAVRHARARGRRARRRGGGGRRGRRAGPPRRPARCHDFRPGPSVPTRSGGSTVTPPQHLASRQHRCYHHLWWVRSSPQPREPGRLPAWPHRAVDAGTPVHLLYASPRGFKEAPRGANDPRPTGRRVAGNDDMKKLLTSVRMAFRSPTRPTFTFSDDSKRQVARRTVARVATGNVRLQNGQYATKDDIDRKYERVKSANFDDA